MREIKFRVWDNTHQFMEELSYPWAIIDGEAFQIKDGKRWNNIILMQYIGLKDKNGKEIYEGDIIKFGDPEGNKEIGQVVYGKQNGAFCFDLPHIGTGIQSPLLNFIENIMCLVAKNNFEIVGNIYENPELLKEKE